MRGDEIVHPVTVLAHGCFDMLHAGHIEHLEQAKRLGDRLVVSVTGDQFVGKGAGRPHYTADQRAAHLRTLRFVDDVIINDAPTAIPMIERIRPHIYVKGGDYAEAGKNGLDMEIAAVERVGGKFALTEAARLSSSRLISRSRFGEEIANYLDQCRARGFWSRIGEAFEKARTLNVVFIGETIIDEYRFVAPLAKPSKEFILAVARDRVERFDGGIIAASRHAEKICRTGYVTQPCGEIRKTRFISADYGHKLFEEYSHVSIPLLREERVELLNEIGEATREADVIVVMDFGHGLLGGMERGQLAPAKFLAVNAQSNAGNFGFNPVTKYRYADYVCVDLPEARLATQNQHGDARAVLIELAAKMNEPPHLIVTSGKSGAHWRCGHVPAFATEPRDTIGAGDAFLAVTAPLIAAGLGTEEAALVGNVAGAMKTEIIGHRASIDGDVLYQTVKSLLK